MNNLLNPDNPVMQFITKIVTTVYLNILWFLCCLPIFTAGAATTALYYVTLKSVKLTKFLNFLLKISDKVAYYILFCNQYMNYNIV